MKNFKWKYLLLSALILGLGIGSSLLIALVNEPPLKPMATYDRADKPFPALDDNNATTPPVLRSFLDPGETFDGRFMFPMMVMMRVKVNGDELDAILNPAGWESDRAAGAPATIALQWGFRSLAQFPNTTDTSLNSKTHGPGSRVFVFTTARNLVTKEKRTFILLTLRSSPTAAANIDTLFGDGGSAGNYASDMKMEFEQETDTLGTGILKFIGTLREPTSGFQIEARATMPIAPTIQASRIIADPFKIAGVPIGVSFVDTAQEPIKVRTPFLFAHQMDRTQFENPVTTSGAFLGGPFEVVAPNNELLLPGGRKLSIVSVDQFAELGENREIFTVILDLD